MNGVGATEDNRLEKESFKPSQLELLAASLRLDASDMQSSLAALGRLLQSISPSGVKVETRKKGILARESFIYEISIRLGNQIYAITNTKPQGQIICSRSKVVRDIVIKTDELTMDKWAASLAQQVASEADQSAASRDAINRILGLS